LLEVVGHARRLVRSDFVRQSLVVFSASTLVNALGYAFHFAISRRIGVVQYGVLSALNAAFMICATLAGIIGVVVVKYAAELRAVGDIPKLTLFIRRLMLFCAVAALLAIAIGVVASPAIAGFLKVQDVHAVALDVIIIGLTVANVPLRAVFQGLEDFGTFAVLSSVESVLRVAFGITLVYLGFGVTGAFAGWMVGSTVSLIATSVVLLRRFRHTPDTKLYIDFRRLAITTVNVGLSTIMLTVIGYFDVIVVKHFADPTTAGLYGALSLSGKIIFFFVAFVPTVLLPKATRLSLGGRSAMPIFMQAMGAVVAISVAGLVVYGIAPGLIVTLLAGQSFAPAAPYVFSYGVAMVMLAALNVVVTFKIGLHRFDFIVPLTVVAIGEIVGISLHHERLGDVITVLIVGNFVALTTSLYRIDASVVVRVPVRSTADVA
jgi:O-antigen/teichoic acid export membrane protein